MLVVLLAFGLSPAHAKDAPNDGLSVLVGTQTAFDGDPASIRLSVRGEVGLSRSAVLGTSVLLPVTLTVTGQQGDGLDISRTRLEVPLSVRARLLPGGPIRVYGDAGIGPAIGTKRVEGLLVADTDATIVAMTRTALGLEIGNPNKLMFVIEPVSWNTYFTSQRVKGRYGLMVGLNVNL